MKLLNRISLVITPQQPMLDWITTFTNEELPSLIEFQSESSSYLLDEPENELPIDVLITEIISQHYLTIWQSELSVWDEFLDHAPTQPNLNLFLQWFNVQLSGLTFDLAQDQLMVADVESM
ncbi:MAG: hypothetical protein HRU24_11705 [Gammaproteobacteria bacterium]|nr:hypothetical protein [Gammaproteobacteria bacterium]